MQSSTFKFMTDKAPSGNENSQTTHALALKLSHTLQECFFFCLLKILSVMLNASIAQSCIIFGQS